MYSIAYGQAPDGEVEDFFVDVSAFDYADLPDSDPTTTGSGDYETLFSSNGTNGMGPRHRIREDLTIGAVIDPETNGLPQINAFGDDLSGVDDEDGVFPPDTIIRGQQAVFQVFVRNQTASPAFLQGFADWNDNGDFEDGYPNTKADLGNYSRRTKWHLSGALHGSTRAFTTAGTGGFPLPTQR